MGILLDTCSIIYIAEQSYKMRDLKQTIADAAKVGELHVSPISAWEIGRLASQGRLGVAVDPLAFFNVFVLEAAANLTVLSPEILIAASFLPGNPHKDPMDRVLMATARNLNISLLTDDRAILAYSKLGHVKTLAC